MTEELLEKQYIRSSFKHMGGGGMTEGVTGYPGVE